MTTADRPRQLTKRDVETLLDTYDESPVAALESALRRLCGRADATFDELVQMLADDGRLSVGRQRSLRAREVDALDALAGELNETRRLPS